MGIVVFLVVMAIVFVVTVCIVYDICFSGRAKYMSDENHIPQDEQYWPYRETILRCMQIVKDTPYEAVSVYSHDGLKLAGKYYHRRNDAPLVIFFHGYRCNALRDGNGIFLDTKSLEYNILLVDQRVHGESEGKTITFGIMERYDCFSWVEWALQRFGEEQKIILAGLSMGAATVLMAADMGLPKQVKGILADCPYSSPKAILQEVMGSMKFPVKPTYFIAKLGAKYIGKFDLEESSAIEAVQKSKLPILIIHGDDDRFVPCAMSRECQLAAADHVELVTIEGAGHGMSHCVDTKKYEKALRDFFHKTLGE